MDLISWSLNAIDKIFATTRMGKGEPTCPDGTFAAGYTMDSWGEWKIVCLSILSVEDVEDIYLFGFMIIGFLLIGAGGYLFYRKIRKVLEGQSGLSAALTVHSASTEGTGRAVNTQTQAVCELNRNQVAITELLRKVDNNMEKLSAGQAEWIHHIRRN